MPELLSIPSELRLIILEHLHYDDAAPFHTSTREVLFPDPTSIDPTDKLTYSYKRTKAWTRALQPISQTCRLLWHESQGLDWAVSMLYYNGERLYIPGPYLCPDFQRTRHAEHWERHFNAELVRHIAVLRSDRLSRLRLSIRKPRLLLCMGKTPTQAREKILRLITQKMMSPQRMKDLLEPELASLDSIDARFVRDCQYDVLRDVDIMWFPDDDIAGKWTLLLVEKAEARIRDELAPTNQAADFLRRVRERVSKQAHDQFLQALEDRRKGLLSIRAVCDI